MATLLAAPASVTGGSATLPVPTSGALGLSGLSHGALRAIDLEIAPGELVGVVAPDPPVASALLDCLGREVDPEAGKIEIDGVVLADLDLDAARAAMLVAAHDTDLFEDTVAANVAATAADPDRIPLALSASAADELAASLPDGLDTVLSERARSLSGGQRQRVALARALATDAPVLVLHDPTTAVDAATEGRIAQRLRAARGGRTTVLVTSSPALLAVADRVIVLLDGTIAAHGIHAELIASSSAYREAVLS